MCGPTPCLLTNLTSNASLPPICNSKYRRMRYYVTQCVRNEANDSGFSSGNAGGGPGVPPAMSPTAEPTARAHSHHSGRGYAPDGRRRDQPLHRSSRWIRTSPGWSGTCRALDTIRSGDSLWKVGPISSERRGNSTRFHPISQSCCYTHGCYAGLPTNSLLPS